ncbi:MAG: response regulator transcription factor [Thermosynechococcaceae cyanobacterium]
MKHSLSNAQVLVVQPPALSPESMRADVQSLGYQLITASNAKTALAEVKQLPALVMIASDLGKDCGFQLCRQLRTAGHQMPLLMLMTTDTLEDRVACLEAGANDYVLSPCQRETLLHRLRLHLQPQHQEAGERLWFANLTLDLSTRTAARGDRTIGLTMKEFELLKLFMASPGEVLTREQILEAVWGYDFMGESNVIEVYIRYLRLKLDTKSDQRLIHTVRGVGYVLREA